MIQLLLLKVIIAIMPFCQQNHVVSPSPASLGMTQSPGFSDVTWQPTSMTLATPSLPPTAGRSGRTAYEPKRRTSSYSIDGFLGDVAADMSTQPAGRNTHTHACMGCLCVCLFVCLCLCLLFFSTTIHPILQKAANSNMGGPSEQGHIT